MGVLWGFGAIGAIVVYYVVLSFIPGIQMASLSEFMAAVVYLFIPIIGIPLVFFVSASKIAHEGRVNKLVKGAENAGLTVTHKTTVGDKMLVIDGEKSQLGIVGDDTVQIFSSKDILSSKVIADGEETTSAATGSVVGRALVGGFLFGGAGAIVGGTTAKRTNQKHIKTIELRILVDDEQAPSHRFSFLSSPKPVPLREPAAAAAMEAVECWQVMVELVMLEKKIPAFSSASELQDHVEAVRLIMERQQAEATAT